MLHFPRPLRLAAGIAVVATAAVSLTACAGDSDAANSESASATSVADFGTFADLEAAAKEEGALNVIALPRDWANYGAVLDLFAERYPEITINEGSPDVSSAEEIQAAKTNAGTDKAPDVFDLGLAVALENVDSFAPYKVEGFDDIPDSLKDPDGRFVGDYGGYMSVGVDTSKFPAPSELSDLAGAKYEGAVSIPGDPTQAGAAFAAVGLASVLGGGSLDDFQPGIDFFGELNSAGNFLKVDVTPATVASGETPVVFDWDYLNAAYMADNPDWQVIVFPDQGYASYYNQAINADAPHPAAARLWQEFLFSDEVQNLFLAGGARPARMDAMTEAGTIDADLAAALPEVPAETLVPSEEQSDAAGTLLGEKWAAAVQ